MVSSNEFIKVLKCVYQKTLNIYTGLEVYRQCVHTCFKSYYTYMYSQWHAFDVTSTGVRQRSAAKRYKDSESHLRRDIVDINIT